MFTLVLTQADLVGARAWHPDTQNDVNKFPGFLDIPQPKQNFEVIKPHTLQENSQLSMHWYFLCLTTQISVSTHKTYIY